MKLLRLLFLLALISGSVCLTLGQQEQLSQLVAQLQKTPSDNALRERIIKLAASMKPVPAIPEEAERRMARGVAAFEGAKSVAEYKDAIKEFQAAVDAAPWYGDAYFKLGFTQDKAEKYLEALQSLKWAQMAAPDAKNIKTLIYEVEFRNEKYNAPEAKAAREKAAKEATGIKTQSDLIGNWKVYVNGEPFRTGMSDSAGRTVDFHYRFDGRGSEIAVYRVVDSDDPVPKYCRRNGGKWPCAGDEDLFARITFDGKAIRGEQLYYETASPGITGNVDGSEIKWTLVNADKLGRRDPVTTIETLRKY